MKIIKLAEHVAVSEQVLPEDIPTIVAQGYKVLINNRPDNEVEGQPPSDDVKAAALAAGLEYHHLPVTAGNFPGPGVDEMASLLHQQDKAVLAFCRTGTRCTNLWIATATSQEREEMRKQARALGFDLAMSAAAT
ncbi:MAG: TIGR01244 family sulfur transferase [Halieaceae bacterium]